MAYFLCYTQVLASLRIQHKMNIFCEETTLSTLIFIRKLCSQACAKCKRMWIKLFQSNSKSKHSVCLLILTKKIVNKKN